MKTINFDDFRSKLSYNDYTAIVYNDGTQQQYSGGEINDDIYARLVNNNYRISLIKKRGFKPRFFCFWQRTKYENRIFYVLSGFLWFDDKLHN